MKASFVVETMTPPALSAYAQVCGWTLARTHARSGDPIAIGAVSRDEGSFRSVDHRVL